MMRKIFSTAGVVGACELGRCYFLNEEELLSLTHCFFFLEMVKDTLIIFGVLLGVAGCMRRSTFLYFGMTLSDPWAGENSIGSVGTGL